MIVALSTRPVQFQVVSNFLPDTVYQPPSGKLHNANELVSTVQTKGNTTHMTDGDADTLKLYHSQSKDDLNNTQHAPTHTNKPLTSPDLKNTSSDTTINQTSPLQDSLSQGNSGKNDTDMTSPDVNTLMTATNTNGTATIPTYTLKVL